MFNKTLFELSGSGGMCIECRDNTDGKNCDQCIEYYFPNLGESVSSVNYCQGKWAKKITMAKIIIVIIIHV